MKVYAIVAADKNLAIGSKGQIPWHLSNDLKYFKKITLGYPIIMGRKNFESIGRALPGRTSIIITRDPYYAVSDALVCHSLVEALKEAQKINEEACFIIGGGQIYAQAMDFVDKIFFTAVDTEVSDADTFFPPINPRDWRVLSEDPHPKDDHHIFAYNFIIYERLE